MLAAVRRAPLLLLLPLCAFAFAPLLRAPFFASADGLLHLYRLVEFDQGIRSGVLYPRWAPDLLAGYGYPIFVFYAPLLYYLAEAFHLLGFGFADALKAAIGAGMAASAAGMYLFGRDLWGRWGGLLSAVAYVYAPYRLVNTYLDGELAQTLAWAWLPWLAWASWRWLRGGQMRYGVLAGVCCGGLIATHSVASWLAALFLGLAMAALLAARAITIRRTLPLAGFLVAGVALAAPYWLPALAEQASVQLDRVRIATYDFHTNLLPLDRLLSTDWAHQYTGYVGVNGPAQLGLVQTLAAAIGLAALAWFAWRKRNLATVAPALLFAGLALAALTLTLTPAAVVWEHVPFGRFLQFPDRLLAIVSFGLAVVAGGLAPSLGRFRWAGALLLAALLVAGATARLTVNGLTLPPSLGPAQVTAYEQVSGAFGTTAKGEFTPRWLGSPPLTSPLIPHELGAPLPASVGPLTITARQPEALQATIAAQRQGPVELPVSYFPGWTATVRGASSPTTPGPHGLVSVDVPAGQSAIALHFGDTPDRRLADALAALGVLALLAVAISRWPRRADVPLSPRWERLGEGLHSLRRAATPAWRPAAALAAGAAVLLAGLALTPGKWPLGSWPVQRAELVSYGGWLQMMGADVSQTGDHVHVTAAFRTGNAANARPVMATVRLMTREVVWEADSEMLPVAGWVTAVPRKLDFDLPLAPGTPAGVYALELEVVFDGGVIGPDSAPLTYGTPRVGAVTLGPLALAQPVGDGAAGQPVSRADFGPLQLAGWQPPAHAQQGQLVPIDLWWRSTVATPGDWGVSLHIVDAAGQVWAGHDDRPRLGYNPTAAWQPGQLQRDVQMALLPHGMPPGDYEVMAGWYDTASKAPVGPQNVLVGHMAVEPASHPDPALLEVTHRLQRDLPDGLRLLGWDLPSTHATAGQALPLRLFWQALSQPSRDHQVTLTFNAHAASLPLPATSRWQPGQLMETRLSLPTTSDWAGAGRVTVSLDGAPPTVELPADLTLNAPARLTSVPPDLSHTTPDTLSASESARPKVAGAARLAGYRESVDGDTLRVSLYWQRLAPLPGDLHVFVHLLDPQGHVAAQHDGVPGQGQRPTGGWADGEYVEDVHQLAIPPAGGPWQVEVGLYDPASGERLGDRLLLAPVAAR